LLLIEPLICSNF